MATVESAQSALFLSHLAKSAKRFCALKDVKILFASGIQAWKWKCQFSASNSSIILPGLWASIGVTRSYSSRPFLCALDQQYAVHTGSPLDDEIFAWYT